LIFFLIHSWNERIQSIKTMCVGSPPCISRSWSFPSRWKWSWYSMDILVSFDWLVSKINLFFMKTLAWSYIEYAFNKCLSNNLSKAFTLDACTILYERLFHGATALSVNEFAFNLIGWIIKKNSFLYYIIFQSSVYLKVGIYNSLRLFEPWDNLSRPPSW